MEEGRRQARAAGRPLYRNPKGRPAELVEANGTRETCCGYCRGTGRVPGPKRDAWGLREDHPDLVTCDYCDGRGVVEDGDLLLPARLAADPECYGPEARRAYA